MSRHNSRLESKVRTRYSVFISSTFTTITVVEIYTSISKKVLASSSKIVLDVSDLN